MGFVSTMFSFINTLMFSATCLELVATSGLRWQKQRGGGDLFGGSPLLFRRYYFWKHWGGPYGPLDWTKTWAPPAPPPRRYATGCHLIWESTPHWRHLRLSWKLFSSSNFTSTEIQHLPKFWTRLRICISWELRRIRKDSNYYYYYYYYYY